MTHYNKFASCIPWKALQTLSPLIAFYKEYILMLVLCVVLPPLGQCFCKVIEDITNL